MIKRCEGCGVKLQTLDKEKIGYINSKVFETSIYCERCFKIKNYGQSLCATKKVDFTKMIKEIDKNTSFVIFLVDILNITNDVIDYYNKINIEKMIVITKRDLLPKSIKDKKLIEYLKEEYKIKENIMCVSSHKKKNIDLFIKEINKYSKKFIYLVGNTNCGKSTFLNTISSSLGFISSIVASPVPNTTLDFIKLTIGKYTFIDTPGFITENSIYNFLNPKEIKKINPKKEIKVKTIQIKEGFCIIIDDILRVDYISGNNNSISFYMNNMLSYKKIKIITSDELKVLPKKQFNIENKEDIVITGLGFASVSKPGTFVVYSLDEKMINVRKGLI